MVDINKFFVDDRGSFCDIKGDFNFDIKRVYICENFKQGTIRGFHYHEFEGKLFYVPRGAVKFVYWKMSVTQAKELSILAADHSKPFTNTVFTVTPKMKILSANKPTTLYIPPGYANAWTALIIDTILIGCSNRTLEESINDDIRISPDHPDFSRFWEVQNR